MSATNAIGETSLSMPQTHPISSRGFSLIEMLIALALISILVVAAMPDKKGQVDQSYVAETLALTAAYKVQVMEYYQASGEFPADNTTAGLPSPREIQGNYLQSMTVENGALHLEMGNKIRPELQGKTLSIRPVFMPGVIGAPVSWVCGHDTIPGEMVAAGPNLTNLEPYQLPIQCR